MQWKELTYAEAESGAKIWAKAGAEKRRERENSSSRWWEPEHRTAESVAGIENSRERRRRERVVDESRRRELRERESVAGERVDERETGK